jgi:hypothetical protein
MENEQNKGPAAFTITEKWEEQSKVLKQKYPRLTVSDLTCEKGHEETLITNLATKLDKNRTDVINILNNTTV